MIYDGDQSGKSALGAGRRGEIETDPTDSGDRAAVHQRELDKNDGVRPVLQGQYAQEDLPPSSVDDRTVMVQERRGGLAGPEVCIRLAAPVDPHELTQGCEHLLVGVDVATVGVLRESGYRRGIRQLPEPGQIEPGRSKPVLRRLRRRPRSARGGRRPARRPRASRVRNGRRHPRVPFDADTGHLGLRRHGRRAGREPNPCFGAAPALASPVATTAPMRSEYLRLRCNSTPPIANGADDRPASECDRSRGRCHEGPS